MMALSASCYLSSFSFDLMSVPFTLMVKEL